MSNVKFDTKAEDMLEPAHLPQYVAQRKAIWFELIDVRESMHIVRGITRFPLTNFVEEDEIGFFWRLLMNNCGDAVILKLHALVKDAAQANLSLARFKNSICSWLRPSFTDWYRDRLRNAKVDADLKAIAEKLREARNKHVAHIQWDHHQGERPARVGIAEEEIERLYQWVKKLFKTCCLTTECVIDMRDYQVAPKAGPHYIDRMLDLVAKDSYFVNEPERRGQWWETDRLRKSSEEIHELSEWRKKYGLPPA